MNTTCKRLLLSIIVPIRNEAHFIHQTLTQIKEQDFPKDCFEVLVVNGQSEDNTEAIIKEFIAQNPEMQIRLLQNRKRLSSAARNIAVRKAKGEYILIIDGHVHLPGSDLLKNYMAAAVKHNARVIGRPQPLDPPDTNYFQRVVALARCSFLAHSKESFIYSNFEGFTSPISIGVMYHRSIFNKIGYFDESFDAAEDLEFNYRLEKVGYQCFTSPGLAIKYYPRSNFSALFHQLRRYGLGRANFIFKHPERFTIETLLPACLFLAMLLIPLALIAAPFIKYIWIIAVTCYLMALSVESLRLLGKHRLSTVLLIPPIIFTIHSGLGLGLIIGFFKCVKTGLFSICQRMINFVRVHGYRSIQTKSNGSPNF